MIDRRNTGGFNLSCRCTSERISVGSSVIKARARRDPIADAAGIRLCELKLKVHLAPETWACRVRLTWVRHTAENHDCAHGWFRAQSDPVVSLASPLTASHARPER